MIDAYSAPLMRVARGYVRFLPADHDRWRGHWASGPTAWQTPEEGVLTTETRQLIVAAIEQLPAAQLTMSLRDIEGWRSEEVCSALEISQGNQRVPAARPCQGAEPPRDVLRRVSAATGHSG